MRRVRSGQVGSLQVGALDVDVLEIRTAEVGAGKVSSRVEQVASDTHAWNHGRTG